MYAHFDGDDIGPKLELMLLDDDDDSARSYSHSISQALAWVREYMTNKGATVVVAGGDDLVARWPSNFVTIDDIEYMRSGFFETCGRTLSVGVGSRASEAASNLRRAKLQGKNQIVSAVVSFNQG
nr:mCpol domain-containing protein [Actinomadura flavalba]